MESLAKLNEEFKNTKADEWGIQYRPYGQLPHNEKEKFDEIYAKSTPGMHNENDYQWKCEQAILNAQSVADKIVSISKDESTQKEMLQFIDSVKEIILKTYWQHIRPDYCFIEEAKKRVPQ